MTKEELITKINWIIEGVDVGDSPYKIIKDINKLIKKEKQINSN